MKNHGFGKLVTFLNQLEQKKISYTLAHHRDEPPNKWVKSVPSKTRGAIRK